MAEIVYGSELSKELKGKLKAKIEQIVEQGGRRPCLTVFLVGDNPASLSYVTGKEKAAREVGIDGVVVRLPADISQKELEENIRRASEDDTVDGILLQLPLPAGLDDEAAIACISPAKDVDGLQPENVGRFFLGQNAFVPCTPLGIMEILKKMGCDPKGKRAVVIGRSKLVGTPVARLLTNANATVTIAHSKTENLPEVCREADILVAAVGRPKMIDSSYVKEGAFVIDVGINRVDGHLVGDVDFDDVKDIAGAITPVPKGVGPMTICMLLWNTLKAYEERK
ncbi:MAG: bifunctional methylenetetrahydrofolate dehydrogenase/methenyltetrahydrofolate cyclohydrolase FolD [Solobacterium sp.]|nr:bifunctional methylenetetrahydrofolate dehydrogenase/methenyltetrahydrofolate cyclohydrolase FolD [Solobacterium sp.]